MSKTKRVAVVGVGALGSHLVMLLRNMPVTLKVIDDDKVETKNVKSQFHTKMVVGKAKVEALKQTMNGLFGVKLETVPHRLTKDNVEQLLTADLVVDCLDNAPSRQIVQDWVRQKDIPCLHGALDADGSFGRVVWDAAFTIDGGSAVGTPTCEDGQHLPFIAITASYMAQSVKQFLMDGRRRGFEITVGGAFSLIT